MRTVSVSGGYRLRLVVLDFDGTITRPGALDFKVIRKQIGCPAGMPVLEFIAGLTDARQRQTARAALDRFEADGAAASRPNDKAEELVHWLKARGLKVAVLTRNSREAVLRALDNFKGLACADFDLLLTRDDPVAPKPAGDGVRHAAEHFGVAPREVLVVGDFYLDMAAGQAAGAMTVLLDSQNDPRLTDVACDYRIRHLDELRPIVRDGLPLPPGKLPNHMLGEYLADIRCADPSVLIQPGVGEDIAAVEMPADEVLILKSDPITFATDAIGRYAVLVNANDIATAGARPRWLLTTLLWPLGTTPSQVRSTMQALNATCRHWGITLCGGHTEISDAVQRPVVVGMMAGTVRRADLIDKQRMQPGDWVLLTKGVAVEGTAIMAREFGPRLAQAGIAATDIAAGRDLLDQIGILAEARIAAQDGLATAMHDVTEGGLAMALEELSIAGGHGIRVDMDRIPILDLTRRFCAALGLDPLGVIGSGSLLITCRAADGQRLSARLRAAKIAAEHIGEVLAAAPGITACRMDAPVRWPRFDTDEIARLFTTM